MDLKYFPLLLLVLASVKYAHGERLNEQIYSSIVGGAACFKRLNGTHQAGCSSSERGAVGVVQMIKETNDAQWIVQNGTAGPYMAVVSTSMFHSVIELFMQNPDNVAGILVYDSDVKASAFTQDSSCPNEYSSAPGSQCSSSQAGGIVWNAPGTGLLQRDIPFPIFFLPQSRTEEIEKIEKCYERYNLDKYNQNGKPLCSIQLNSFMYAAVNTVVCMRRSASSALLSSTKVCDPLGNSNVYYSLFPRGEKDSANKSVILVTARMDSASLFDGVAAGAASSVVGMVTTLTAAIALSKMVPDSNTKSYDKNVLWTFFNGEAFDYIGSQRVAYDISKGEWPPSAPLAPGNIDLHVEVGQIGGSLMHEAADWPMFAFAPYGADMPDSVREFFNIINNKLNVTVTPKFTTNLPPSSLHSFRRILKNFTETGLPELVLVDHEEAFTNPYYNSALDDYEKIGFDYRNITVPNDGTFKTTEELIAEGIMTEKDLQVRIARLANALSQTLYQRVVGTPYTGPDLTSAHMVDEMLYCFLKSQDCRLFRASQYNPNKAQISLPQRPASLYVGVATWSSFTSLFVGHMLALLSGTHLNVNQTDCDAKTEDGYSFYWLTGWSEDGVCIQTTMNFSQAVSPAFIETDYDFTSGMYSTWTESVWQAMWARVFVSAGGGGAQMAAIFGALATVLAAFITFWLQRHSDRVFINAPTESIVNSDAATGILRTVNC